MTDPSIGKMDRTVVKIARRGDPDDWTAYWLTKTPEERLQAVEEMRQIIYGYGPDTRLPRPIAVAQRKRR